MDEDVDEAAKLTVAQARAKSRCTAFLSTIPPDLQARADRIEAELQRENASARTKLAKIDVLLVSLAKFAEPYTACRKGCSACCRMNVTISSVEAERLAAASGRRMARVSRPLQHPLKKFSGVACPFLIDDTCSVYEARPFACRMHMSFDLDSYWCEPDRAYAGEMAGIQLKGAAAAYRALVGATAMGGTADIRDFFPG